MERLDMVHSSITTDSEYATEKISFKAFPPPDGKIY